MKLGKQLLSLLCSQVHYYYYFFFFFPNSTLLWLINHVNKTLYRHERERERERTTKLAAWTPFTFITSMCLLINDVTDLVSDPLWFSGFNPDAEAVC